MHKVKLKILLPPEKEWSFLLAIIFHRVLIMNWCFLQCIFLPRSRAFQRLAPFENVCPIGGKNQIRSNILCRSQSCKVTEFFGALKGLGKLNQYVFISVDETR